jgi:hypothetical protein
MSIKQEQLQLTGGNNNNDRRNLDYYPTPKNVTVALLNFLKIPNSLTLWDPACGTYNMSNVFKEYGHKTLETDIIYGQNYFTTYLTSDAIITNPPFNLASEFITKAVNEANLVAMLFKSQFWHAAKRYHLFQRYPPQFVLPLTWRPDFLEHERAVGAKGSPTMDVAWTVWDKSRGHHTIYSPLIKP